jgi:hypothetical protein
MSGRSVEIKKNRHRPDRSYLGGGPEGQLNGGEGNKGSQGFGMVPQILGETLVASEP